jgi:hypothetical protein
MEMDDKEGTTKNSKSHEKESRRAGLDGEIKA